MSFPAEWIVPQWPAQASVGAVCSTRTGGVSAPPYDSLNLGDHVGDDPHAVAANRERFDEAILARPVFLRQVHGRGVIRIDEDTENGTEADACFTSSANVACTIMVADCLPVLLALEDGSFVGAAHCGWRGLAGGVLEAAVAHMLDEAGEPPSALLAWLGPCIGPESFEVGPEVKAAFEARVATSAVHFRPHTPGKFLADLPALARARLARLGLTRIGGNDGTREWCTVANTSRFFSHRRDRVSGRFAAAVWRR